MKAFFQKNADILIVLLIATSLRFWNLGQLEYTYDELSAIFRAQFHTFSDLIRKGVIPDGHPAGMQVIIWLVGDRVLLLKSLSAFAGVAAVYFLWKAAKSLLGNKTAISAALFLSILYEPVLWSQQIRPYSMGLMASMLMLYAWSKLYHEPNVRWSLLWSFAAVLGAYLHYFAALFACLLFLTGVIKFRNRYWLLPVAICSILCLPHAHITWQHLQHGGLQWLSVPQWNFIFEYWISVFSGSRYFLFIIFILSLTRLTLAIRNKVKFPSILGTLFLLHILPIILGFVYSRLFSPVLQNSVLLFTLPCLLMLLAWCIAQTPRFIFRLQFFIILTVGIAVLTIGKKHYTLGYLEPWSSAVALSVKPELPKKKYADGPQDVLEYHRNKKCVQPVKSSCLITYLNSDLNYAHKINSISLDEAFSLICGSGTDPALVPVLEEHAVLAQRHSFIGAEYLVFEPMKHQKKFSIKNATDTLLIKDVISFSFTSLASEKNDILLIKFRPENPDEEGEIQTSIYNNHEQIDWRNTAFKGADTAFFWHYHAIKTADIPGIQSNSEIRIRVVNREKPVVGKLMLRIAKGNPYLYGVSVK